MSVIARIRRAGSGPMAALIRTEESTTVICLLIAFTQITAAPMREFAFKLFFRLQTFAAFGNFLTQPVKLLAKLRHCFISQIGRNISTPHVRGFGIETSFTFISQALFAHKNSPLK